LLSKSYVEIIKNNPLLSKKEEIVLSREAKKGNQEARKKLVESNLRLVISIAKKYHRSNINFEDLLQESSVGLLKAVDKFDPELGYKFSTYACWWIKQAALQYLNENSTNIKVPTHSRMLNSKIKSFMKDFETDNNRMPTTSEISKKFDISNKKVAYTLKANKNIASLDKENENSNFSLKDTFKDESVYSNPEAYLEKKELDYLVRESLKLLTPKEEKIIRLRFGISENANNIKDFPVTPEMEKYLNEK